MSPQVDAPAGPGCERGCSKFKDHQAYHGMQSMVVIDERVRPSVRPCPSSRLTSKLMNASQLAVTHSAELQGIVSSHKSAVAEASVGAASALTPGERTLHRGEEGLKDGGTASWTRAPADRSRHRRSEPLAGPVGAHLGSGINKFTPTLCGPLRGILGNAGNHSPKGKQTRKWAHQEMDDVTPEDGCSSPSSRIIRSDGPR